MSSFIDAMSVCSLRSNSRQILIQFLTEGFKKTLFSVDEYLVEMFYLNSTLNFGIPNISIQARSLL